MRLLVMGLRRIEQLASESTYSFPIAAMYDRGLE